MVLISFQTTAKRARSRPATRALRPWIPPFLSAPRCRAQRDLLHRDPRVARQISTAPLRTRRGTKQAPADVDAANNPVVIRDSPMPRLVREPITAVDVLEDSGP